MKKPAWLTIDAVLAFHEQLVAEHGGSPMVRDRGTLESALASPLNRFAYGEHDLFVLAAAYANGITRNHPFADGNKRTAFIAAYTFLSINGLNLAAPETEAVAFMVGLSDRTIAEAEFADWLRRRCVARRNTAGKRTSTRPPNARSRRRR